MNRSDVLLTAPIIPSVVEQLDARYIVHRLWEQTDQTGFLETVGPRIRGMATNTLFGKVGDALLDRLPHLEIIASFGVGYDNIDTAAAARRGVVVTNTPSVLDDEVADLTIGLLLATLRRIPQADRFVREGHWPNGPFPLSPTLRGRQIGIVGLGNIGKAVARRLAGFDVTVRYHGRAPQPDVPYDFHATTVDLAAVSDVLIVLVPGGAGTAHLIDKDIFAALGPNGVFINVSRGSVVDEQALIDALESKAILAAGLDVYQREPQVPDILKAMPNVVLLPHIGSGSEHTRTAMGQLLVDNLAAWFTTGRALTPVPESLVVKSELAGSVIRRPTSSTTG